MNCTSCGARDVDNARFCKNCGERLLGRKTSRPKSPQEHTAKDPWAERASRRRRRIVERVLGVAILIVVIVGGCRLLRLPEDMTSPYTGDSYVPQYAYSTAAPESQQGFVRSRPAPFGVSVTHDDMRITVLDVVTTAQVKAGSREWPDELRGIRVYGDVDEDHEGVVIKVRLRNLVPPDETKSYSPIQFRVTGSRGVIYDKWFNTDGGGYLESGEFFGDTVATGWIIQQYHKSDRELLLIYSPPLAGSSYYSLTDSK